MITTDVLLQLDNIGQPVADGATFQRRPPISGDVVTVAASAKSTDVNRAVQSAQAAFETWSQKGPSEKRAILNRCADVLEAREEEFVEVGVNETGGTPFWYRNNVKIAASMLRD
ncbi:MAG: aldehyde dehydrogenase family protein [Pseudomonadota bacterium]